MKFFSVVLLLFATNTFAQQQYKPVRLYDRKDVRTEGFIFGSTSDRLLNYKKTLNQTDPVKIEVYDFNAIVIEEDSFIVVRDFKVESDVGRRMLRVSSGLSKVLENGKVRLYQTYYAGDRRANGYLPTAKRFTYLLQREGTTELVSISMEIDVFVKQMSEYFKSSPAFVKRIKKKDYSYLKAQQMVADYNAMK